MLLFSLQTSCSSAHNSLCPIQQKGSGTLIYIGEDCWGHAIAHLPVFIFLFLSTGMHFCKLFTTLDFISAAHWWDNISVPPCSFWRWFPCITPPVSSTFSRTLCGADYPEISSSCLRQDWSCLSQPTCEIQISLSSLLGTAHFLRYTNARRQFTCGLFQTILP